MQILNSLKNHFSNSTFWLKEVLNQNLLISKYNVVILGLVGFIGHPFYWFWWTYIDPQPEITLLRIIGIVTCFLLFTFKYWPESLKKFFPLYWFLTATYNLPFFFTVYLINTKFSLIWSMAQIGTIFCISSIFSYVLSIISLAVGASLGIIYSIIVIPELFVYFNQDTAMIYFPVFSFTIITSIAFSYHRIKSLIELEKQTSQSIAGNIAHEIRNPINVINFASSEIKNLALDQSQNHNQKIIELTSHISDSIVQANNIINITLHDMKDDKIDPADFAYLSTNETLAGIINKFSYRGGDEKEKIILKTNSENDFIFKAGKERFSFIIYNLLKNALYYLDDYPNSKITIGSDHKTINDKEYNVIYVEDEGPGIPAEILPKLFGSFASFNKKGGTGLGLSFCKRNMKIFGGDIICESEIGSIENGQKKNGRTRFSLLFPKISDEEILMAQTQIRQRKILLVDDQKVNLLTAKAKIEKNLPDIICDIVTSGKEAVKMLRENYEDVNAKKYQLVIMDIQMPEFTGISATAKIREFNKTIPIIAYSSLDFQNTIAEINSYNLGKNINHNQFAVAGLMNDFIQKPAIEHILCRTVSKWLKNYEDDFSYLPENYKTTFQGKNIIVADDLLMNAMFTKKALTPHGINVTIAKNGQELLDIYNSDPEKFDLIATDINMPEMNGDEAAKQIRKSSLIPIIAISGDDSEEDINHFFACGITDYYVKGKDNEMLLKIIASNLIKDNFNPKIAADKNLNIAPNIIFDNSDLTILDSEIIGSFNQKDKTEILETFFKDSENLLNQIHKNKETGNIRELFLNIHALKGILGNIGAKKMFQYAKNINSSFKNNKLPEDQNWLDKLEKIYGELMSEIESGFNLRKFS